MEQNAIDTLWNAAQCAVQRMADFFRRISELLKGISWKIVRSYASNMAFYFNLATDRQISLMYHKRARTRKKWYRIILRRIGRFMKERNTIPFKPKPFSIKSKAKQRTAEDALAGMRTLPIPALVTTINMMIGVLSERGFQIYDWDNKDKAVYKLVFRGGKIYALIPHTAKKEDASHAETPVSDERG